MRFLHLVVFVGTFLFPWLAGADALDQWITRTSSIAISVNDMAYAKGFFVAVGDGDKPGEPRLIVSSNGVNWIRFASFARFSLRSITYGSNGFFVAVGRTDIYDGASTPGVIASTNGTNWAFFPTFGIHSGAQTNFEAVTYGNGLFVAVGDNGIAATSLDGTNWATHSTPTTYPLTGVAYGNGVWVATGPREPAGGPAPGSPGPRLISTDGTNWVQLETDFNATCVLFARGMFLAIAGDTFNPNLRPMRYSLDGTNWTAISEPAIHIMSRITYGGGIFAAVGRGIIKTSFTGTNDWVRRHPATLDATNQLRAVAYGANTFVAAGDAILQSEDIRPRLGVTPSDGNDLNRYDFTLSGLSNALYRVNISTNLIDWSPGPSVRATGSEQLLFNESDLWPRRFFRAVHVPE